MPHRKAVRAFVQIHRYSAGRIPRAGRSVASVELPAGGRATGPVGAVVPHARVLALEDRTGLSASTIANAQGYFVFLSLQPGEYTVTADAPGFRKAVIKGVILNAAATVVEDFKLEIGPVTEAINVEARKTTVQLSDSQVQRVVAVEDIASLPQLERNPIALAIFQPGVQIRGGNIGLSRINGTRQGSNFVRVDGIDATGTDRAGAVLLRLNAPLPTRSKSSEFVTHWGRRRIRKPCRRAGGDDHSLRIQSCGPAMASTIFVTRR